MTEKSRDITRVVHVTREYGAIAGAGGIKDVAEGLCRAAAGLGIETHVFLPGYRSIFEKQDLDLTQRLSFGVTLNYGYHNWNTDPVGIMDCQLAPNLTLHLVCAPRYEFLYEGHNIPRRGIYQYTREEAEALGRPDLEGKGYFDYFAMNTLLVKAVLQTLGHMSLRPDIIHCHDGHAALLPFIAQGTHEPIPLFLRRIGTALTIHNAGIGYHQETPDLDFASAMCGVDRVLIDRGILAGRFDPLFAGGLFCGAVNTVSENYAHELKYTVQDAGTDWLGHALMGAGVELQGVTNGVDPERFNPGIPERLGIPAAFDPVKGKFDGKRMCKTDLIEALAKGEAPENISLQGRLNPDADAPLVTFIGRISGQKGFDMLIDALYAILGETDDVRVVGLGDGDPHLVYRFQKLTDHFPGRMILARGYSPTLANRIFAAGDFFVVPSRFEPCGQTDFFAQMMGNIPIVHEVGGLVKVVDKKFGFTYLGGSFELADAMRRALAIFRESGQKRLRQMQIDAAKNLYANFTWDRVLQKKYFPLYRQAMAKARPASPYLTEAQDP